MKLPFTLPLAEYRGTTRQAGSFDNEQGVTINFSERVRFEYEDADGVLQDIEFGLPQLDEVATFDVTKLARGELVTLSGEVGEGRRGIYVRPLSITRNASSARAAS